MRDSCSKVDAQILIRMVEHTQASGSLIAAHSRFKLSCPGVLFKRYPPFASRMARHKRDIEFPSRFHFTAALHNHLDAHALGCFIAVINYSDGHNEIELTLFRSSQANLEARWFVAHRGAGVYEITER